jgi:hypothetical protein
MGENGCSSVKSVWKSAEKCEKVQKITLQTAGLKE